MHGHFLSSDLSFQNYCNSKMATHIAAHPNAEMDVVMTVLFRQKIPFPYFSGISIPICTSTEKNVAFNYPCSGTDNENVSIW